MVGAVEDIIAAKTGVAGDSKSARTKTRNQTI
jgi:hypothetical protein